MRVGAGAFAEHEVAVLLVGVGAGGVSADEDVADPDGSRALAIERALVIDAALGIRGHVFDVDALLDVLASIGEVEAEQLGICALRDEVSRRIDAHDLAAE